MWAGKRSTTATGHVALDRNVEEESFNALFDSDRTRQILPLSFGVGPGIKQSASPSVKEVSRSIPRTEFMLLVLSLALCLSFMLAAAVGPRQSSGNDTNDGIHLAIGPDCGSLSGKFSDVNSGLLDPRAYKTIVSFGDSYSELNPCHHVIYVAC